MKKNNIGQSLLEVVFAVGVMALIGVTIVALSTGGVRNTSFSENRTKANKYVQQAMEWVKQQKDEEWDSIHPHASNTSTPRKYCFSCLTGIDPGCTATWSNSGGMCDISDPTDKISGTVFFREVWLIRVQNPPYEGCTKEKCFTADVRIYWTDAQGTHDVEAKSLMTKWEDL